MQRNQFKNEIGIKNSYTKVQKVSFNAPGVNTFSECVKDAVYKAPTKHVIHVRNKKIDSMKNLI